MIGTTNITAVYAGNNKYLASNDAKTTFNTTKRNTKITVNKIPDAITGEKISITGTLTDDLGNVLKNTWVQLKVNTVSSSAKTDAKVLFTTITTRTTAGENKVTVTCPGNNYYNNNNSTVTFNVKTIDTKIVIGPIASTAYGRTINITGKITDKNNKVVKTTLTVTLNGKSITVKSDANGTFKISTKTNKPMTGNVTVTFNGNNYYSTSTAISTYTVTARDTKITINPIKSVSWGNTVTITGTFQDANGNIFKNTAIQASVNGEKTFKVKTDKNGVFTITTKTSKPMTGTITASFVGNNYYKTTNTTAKYSVTARKTIFTYNKIKATPFGSM